MTKLNKFSEYRYLVASDLYRYDSKNDLRTFIRSYLLIPEFKYSFWIRTSKFFEDVSLFRYTLLIVGKLFHRHYSYKFGMSIPYRTEIGPGFYIGHFSGIVVSPKAVIGRNCNISQNVTVGKSNRGKRKGFPTIGNNVYIGPGAVIIGDISIGDIVAIGANAVVLDDVPESAAVAGVPAKVVSHAGSTGYVNRTDYDQQENT